MSSRAPEWVKDTAAAAGQLGVDYNAHVIDSILTHVAPALGWR
jgi:hypothetical protein